MQSHSAPIASIAGGERPPAGFKEAAVTFASDLFKGGIELINGLFQIVLDQYLVINPELLETPALHTVNENLQVVFFLLLGLYALVTLGMFQLFPDKETADPIRFGSRALAATLSLWIVNPPVSSESAFGKGAIGWGVMITNTLIKLFSDYIAISGSSLIEQSLLAKAIVGLMNPFTQWAFFLFFIVPVALSELLLLLGLILRQVLVLVVFALYPILILFWVADAGPLKYGKKLSEKLLHSMVKTLVGGILITAVLAMGTSIVQHSTQIFATREGLSPQGALFSVVTMLLFILVTCGLSAIMLKGMLGTLGDAATKAIGGGVTLAATVAATAVTLPAGGIGGLASLGGGAGLGGLGATGGTAASATGSAVASGASTAASSAASATSSAAASGASSAASGAASATGSAAASGAGTSMTSGTSGVASGALSNTARQGLQQTASTAGKGLTETMKQTGEKAAKKAPDAAKKVGKKTAEQGKSAAENTVNEAQAMGEDLEAEDPADGPENPSMSSRNYSSGSSQKG